MAKSTRRRSRKYRSLKDYIERSGDSQDRIAAEVGTSQAHISRIAAGLAIPRPMLAAKLAKYAHIPLDSFIRAHVAHEVLSGEI
jgi:transcriptional regulator with XRE-family HTH domain